MERFQSGSSNVIAKFLALASSKIQKVRRKSSIIATNKKLISIDDEIIKPTLLGQRFLNDLLSIFLK